MSQIIGIIPYFILGIIGGTGSSDTSAIIVGLDQVSSKVIIRSFFTTWSVYIASPECNSLAHNGHTSTKLSVSKSVNDHKQTFFILRNRFIFWSVKCPD